MFHGPSFIVSTMQEETTPIFKHLWYDWTQQQPGIEPTNPLGQCWVPPIVAFYDQQGLLRTYSLPGGSIRSPHPGSPRGLPTEVCVWPDCVSYICSVSKLDIPGRGLCVACVSYICTVRKLDIPGRGLCVACVSYICTVN